HRRPVRGRASASRLTGKGIGRHGRAGGGSGRRAPPLRAADRREFREGPVSDERTQRLPTLEKEPRTDTEQGAGDLRQSKSAAGYEPASRTGTAGRAGRFWSVRRLPAGVVAL